jgi:hypothetical protein
MKLWLKVVIAVVGSGAVGGLTFYAGQNPTWSTVFSYINLAIGGTMSILIGWPPKTETK